MVTVKELALGQLRVSESQARRRDVELGLDELVESIRLHGLLEPIVVQPADDDGIYEIVTGQRRFLAHQRLERRTIVAQVLDGPVDPTTTRVLSLTENVIRQDLSGKDLVDVCTVLFQQYGSASAVAEETGIPYVKVLKYVKYDRLQSELRALVDSGEVKLDVALKAQDIANNRANPDARRGPGRPAKTDPNGNGKLNGHALNGKDRGTRNGHSVVAASASNGTIVIDPATHFGSDPVELARQLSGLTKIQQRQLEREVSEAEVPIPGAISKVKGNNMPKQIVVTLTAAHHRALQVYASRKGLTQDVAAARLIVQGLQGLM